MIELKGVSSGYDKKKVLNDVSLQIDESKITVVMGPNGAGKSTLLKTIYGLLPLDGGSIEFEGKKIVPTPQFFVRQGVFLIPQGKRVFRNMTVLENLELATHFWKSRKEFDAKLQEVLAFFPDLKSRLDALAGNLSGGEQQMVALARALLNQSKLILMDEPSIGLSPKLINDTFNLIYSLNKGFGTGFVIVEHNLKSLLPLTHNAFIFVQGEVVYNGKAESQTLNKMLTRIFAS